MVPLRGNRPKIFAGEVDVSSTKRSQRVPLLEDFRRLRLEHGFPRGLPGRG